MGCGWWSLCTVLEDARENLSGSEGASGRAREATRQILVSVLGKPVQRGRAGARCGVGVKLDHQRTKTVAGSTRRGCRCLKRTIVVTAGVERIVVLIGGESAV